MSVVTCTIVINGKKLPYKYQLVKVAVSKQINQIPSASFTLYDDIISNKRLIDDPLFTIGNEVEILLRYEGGRNKEQSVFKGIIVRQIFEGGYEGCDITVELQDMACSLEKTESNHKFQNRTDTEIIKSLIESGGGKVGEIPAFRTKHSEVVQSKCSNWEFLQQQAKHNKMMVLAENGVVSLRKPETESSPKHQLELGVDEIYNFSIQTELSPTGKPVVDGTISIRGSGKIQLLDIINLMRFTKASNGDHTITGIEHIVDEKGWVTKIQFGVTGTFFRNEI